MEFTLKTLRQAKCAMRPPSVKTSRQIAILQVLPVGSYLTPREIALALDIDRNTVYGTITQMHDKRLLDRIGDVGDYRYSSTPAGRGLIVAMK